MTLPAELRERPAAERLGHILDALIAASIANRRSAALLRWQNRYLEAADRQILIDQLTATDAVVRALLAETRPELDGADRTVLAAAAMSVIGSISDHHVSVPVRPLTTLLRAACRSVTTCELPPLNSTDTESVGASEIPLTFKHELLLKRAVELFHARGYPNVSVEDIATAAGLPASSAVYRFYRSKGDILAAAFRRAADRVSAAIGPAIAASDSPEQALTTLIELYVTGSFAERDLTFVYYAEISNVPAEARTVLRNIQRLNVEEWAKLLAAVRPEAHRGRGATARAHRARSGRRSRSMARPRQSGLLAAAGDPPDADHSVRPSHRLITAADRPIPDHPRHRCLSTVVEWRFEQALGNHSTAFDLLSRGSGGRRGAISLTVFPAVSPSRFGRRANGQRE